MKQATNEISEDLSLFIDLGSLGVVKRVIHCRPYLKAYHLK